MLITEIFVFVTPKPYKKKKPQKHLLAHTKQTRYNVATG